MLSERKRRIAIGVALLALLQVAAIAIYRGVEGKRSTATAETFRFEELSGDALAPDILLERSDGTRTSLQALGGGVRLVHFWATWCPPCVDELPGLFTTSRKLSAEGLTLIAISMDDDWDVIRTFFSGEVPAGIYRAVDKDAYREFDVATLPDSYLVPRNGRLQLRYGGARDWLSAVAQEHLRDQLGP
jgi:thiol-disulfide isomerase/thioredoxin